VLEDFNRRALDLGQAAARFDRARRRRRKQQAVDIGLREIDREDDQKHTNHDLREAVAHRRPPGSFYRKARAR